MTINQQGPTVVSNTNGGMVKTLDVTEGASVPVDANTLYSTINPIYYS